MSKEILAESDFTIFMGVLSEGDIMMFKRRLAEREKERERQRQRQRQRQREGTGHFQVRDVIYLTEIKDTVRSDVSSTRTGIRTISNLRCHLPVR
ncbi:hypothetical protein CHS0354_038296 [Potamilus streckersoni]|uniref:Uncharacterized protein n=1 Tax=Potamilus streckersoni TaxID=2493646 RepID=A0AAE0TCL2_9BIVA|nr:hypothetical protein CHS0354_038296 [Potamilus streckersoni]